MMYGILRLKFHPQQSAVRLKAGRFDGSVVFPGRIIQLESLPPGQSCGGRTSSSAVRARSLPCGDTEAQSRSFCRPWPASLAWQTALRYWQATQWRTS